jgi:hypothetical protein
MEREAKLSGIRCRFASLTALALNSAFGSIFKPRMGKPEYFTMRAKK